MPQLVLTAIRGPIEGQSFALTASDLSIGRESTNHIELPDLLVSRRHCILRQDPNGEASVADLGSSNGTYVNGNRVQRAGLGPGDRLEIGQSVFLLTTEQDPAGLVRLEESPEANQETVLLSVATRPVSPEPDLQDWIARRRDRELRAFLSIGIALSRWKNLADLQDLILRETLEATPADRAAIVFLNSSGEIVETRGRSRSGSGNPIVVSRSLVTEAVQTASATLHRLERGNKPDTGSLLQSDALSVLAAPLIVQGSAQAVLYLDSNDANGLCENHLELISAVAGMAATPLQTARRVEQLELEKRVIEEGAGSRFQMIGESPAMVEVYQMIGRTAPSDATVLILGESGTGKEMAARAIHAGSPRHRGPWIAVNCACLAENLLESDLFGHERGAFTNAIATKQGKLELVDGGTLFLDEVGEIPPPVQAKLLRVLQEHEFERVGGTRTRRTNFRLIAATNQDLRQQVSQGRFRADLFYRLNVVNLRMPALRDRGDDVLLLASYFLARMAPRASRKVEGISPAARRALRHWNWPGNVRELQNVLERAVILGNDCEIQPEDLPEELMGGVPAPVRNGYHATVHMAKKQVIQEALDAAGGSVVNAARALGINSKYLHRLMKNLDLRDPGQSNAEPRA